MKFLASPLLVVAYALARSLRLDGRIFDFDPIVRIDTPLEASYYRHGGILPYILCQLAARPPP